MKRILTAILLLSLTIQLCACAAFREGFEAGMKDSAPTAETAKPAAVQATKTPAAEPSYEVTMQRATTWVSGTGSQWVQIVAAIENTGSANLYLSSGAYDLEDASGALVCSGKMVSEYPDVLAPGETGYLYDTVLLDEPVEGELTLLARPDADKARVNLIRYETSDIDLTMDKYGDLKIKGRVENTTTEPSDLTQIVAALYDEDGEFLGLGFTFVDETLEPGMKVGFTINVMELPESLLEQAATCCVWAYPVQYNW